jgi:hypothetical protein
MEAEILFAFRVVRPGKKIEAYSPVPLRLAWPCPKRKILLFFNLLEATIFDAILKMQFYGI